MSKRYKQLENAVAEYLTLKKLKYIRVENYRCFKCGQVQNAHAKGFPDFLIRKPLCAVECKTGTGRLSKEQKEVKKDFDEQNIPYIIVRDNIDALIEFVEGTKNSYKRIFDFWQSQKRTIKHKKYPPPKSSTMKYETIVDKILLTYSEDEICQAIKNYDYILGHSYSYFKYKWTLSDFLMRGIEKFIDLQVCKDNFIRQVGKRFVENEEDENTHNFF